MDLSATSSIVLTHASTIFPFFVFTANRPTTLSDTAWAWAWALARARAWARARARVDGCDTHPDARKELKRTQNTQDAERAENGRPQCSVSQYSLKKVRHIRGDHHEKVQLVPPAHEVRLAGFVCRVLHTLNVDGKCAGCHYTQKNLQGIYQGEANVRNS